MSEPVDATIIDASETHLDAIAEIYATAVETSHATFDLVPPPPWHWQQLLASTRETPGHFLLVAIDDDERVLGYAYSTTYMTRAAYDTTCLVSVYLDDAARGRGLGTALYRELFRRLDDSPLRLAVAGISEPNPASTALHTAFGFERVGTFNGVGVKFGRAIDVTWYQRPLAGAEPPAAD
ncbi:MAG TPA: GNAT family N-acetyltransferase [Solirubrobacterales bacterium]|nr:GNAT family N-acetyltransferase [Solirubrobacterales bacterium]